MVSLLEFSLTLLELFANDHCKKKRQLRLLATGPPLNVNTLWDTLYIQITEFYNSGDISIVMQC